jgi:hypothetical protein
MIKIHLSVTKPFFGGTKTSSLCRRLRTTADGMNLTGDEKEVTCRFCLRILKARHREEQGREGPRHRHPSPAKGNCCKLCDAPFVNINGMSSTNCDCARERPEELAKAQKQWDESRPASDPRPPSIPGAQRRDLREWA